MSPSVHPANPLGILVANLLSPALVKKEEDIPLMVRELMRYRHTHVHLCAVCVCVGMMGSRVHTRVYVSVCVECVHEPV